MKDEICTLENLGPTWICITKSWYQDRSYEKQKNPLPEGLTRNGTKKRKVKSVVDSIPKGELFFDCYDLIDKKYVFTNFPYKEARKFIEVNFDFKNPRMLIDYAQRHRVIRNQFMLLFHKEGHYGV
jgi:hypothetical protein